MFEKLIRAAQNLDKLGKFNEADAVTEFLKTAASHVDNPNNIIEMLNQIFPALEGEGSLAPAKRPYNKKPSKINLRPELNDITTEKTVGIDPFNNKPINKQIIDYSPNGNRKKIEDAFRTWAREDPYAEKFLEVLNQSKDIEKHPWSRTTFTPYGPSSGVILPGSRTLFESANPGARGTEGRGGGGKHNLSPGFITHDQAVENATKVKDEMNKGLNDRTKRMHADLLYAGGDRDTTGVNPFHSIIRNLALENAAKPAMEALHDIRSRERAEQGYDMNTTELKPDQFHAHEEIDMNRWNPKAKGSIFNSPKLKEKALEHIQKKAKWLEERGLDPYKAIYVAIVSSYIEGIPGIAAGVKTFRPEDTFDIQRSAPKSGYPDSRMPNFFDIISSDFPGQGKGEPLGLGKDMSDFNPEEDNSLRYPVLEGLQPIPRKRKFNVWK